MRSIRLNKPEIHGGTPAGRRYAALAAVSATVLVVAAPQPALAAPPAAPDKPLAKFHDQPVTWEECVGLEDSPQLKCAELTVPLDYQRPDGETITVTMSRLSASDQENRAGVLLVNPGGPGGPGIDLPLLFEGRPFAERYDVIGFDPRGFGESTPVECEVNLDDVPDLPSRPTDDELESYTTFARVLDEGCEQRDKERRPYVSTANTARDMDVMRAVLGEEKINYLGFSYGTYLGAVYGSLFPDQLNRSVLDSSVNPDGIWRESFKAGSVASRENLEEWAAWVGARDRAFGLGTSGPEVFANTEKVAARLAEEEMSIPLLDIPIDRTLYDTLISELTRDRSLWTTTAVIMRVLFIVAEGEAAADSAQAAEVGRALTILQEQERIVLTPAGLHSNVLCEAEWPSDLETYYADMRVYRERYPYGFGVMVAAPTMCTFRSFDAPEPVVELKRDYPAGLVVQGELDAQTPGEGGVAMAKTLDQPLVMVTDEGRHGQYLDNTCVQDIVDRYLVDGDLPADRTTCAGLPRPNVPADSAASRTAPLPSLTALVDQLAAQGKAPRLPQAR